MAGGRQGRGAGYGGRAGGGGAAAAILCVWRPALGLAARRGGGGARRGEAAEPRPDSQRGFALAGSSGLQLIWPPRACCRLPRQRLPLRRLERLKKKSVRLLPGPKGWTKSCQLFGDGLIGERCKTSSPCRARRAADSPLLFFFLTKRRSPCDARESPGYPQQLSGSVFRELLCPYAASPLRRSRMAVTAGAENYTSWYPARVSAVGHAPAVVLPREKTKITGSADTGRESLVWAEKSLARSARDERGGLGVRRRSSQPARS